MDAGACGFACAMCRSSRAGRGIDHAPATICSNLSFRARCASQIRDSGSNPHAYAQIAA
jgi:hypothetical protein